MTLTSHRLAEGPGWSVSDVVCTSGPRDRPFEERHDAVSIAAVTQGSFQYRSERGFALLAPGALMLGNAGACFRCGHEHGTGDRCLAFQFTPEHFETIVAEIPGIRRADFSHPALPPSETLTPILAAAESARDMNDREAFEELALRLAGAAIVLTAGASRTGRTPSTNDQRRVTRVLRRIEATASEPLRLSALAQDAAMSPYHFLRTFRHVAGLTPHQFVLRARLHRAALYLLQTKMPIGEIALESGFNDLSSFNRRFRRAAGLSPRAYRARGPRL